MTLKHWLGASALLLGSVTTGAVLAQASTETPSDRIVSYDFGSVDTLHQLGLSGLVVGLPKHGLPQYLEAFKAHSYIDAGGLKSPDLAAVEQLSPSQILITGRQSGQQEALAQIAPVTDVSLPEGDYWTAFSTQVHQLADPLNAKAQATDALANLHQHLDQLKQQVSGQKTVLLVTHNDGHFGLRQSPIISELLGLKSPSLPDDVKSIKRGSRVFTPLTIANITQMAPDVLLVVDRSAAIGQTDQALNLAQLKQQLADQQSQTGQAANTITQVKVLTPKLWYLSGNGLESVRLQAEEVAKAIE
ncbi:hypothetical protein BFW38_13350 [Terasakiispira papahanaumokuakeensis]|uniref:Fe/B12 periplasmic-binding domain-containing protein n=1 Tax=Terasakiispira papahanaumokuakeensis TaxID=197479 RepID=A0A1E2VC04_9GAMM|nr:ABC transporter substrate-binding protein [Terasakiispira papahanaumokuakeensis]ODC04372.1 hypothetical protein BFW38_13350 [Terasakiispira papahanaumokuakeensis]